MKAKFLYQIGYDKDTTPHHDQWQAFHPFDHASTTHEAACIAARLHAARYGAGSIVVWIALDHWSNKYHNGRIKTAHYFEINTIECSPKDNPVRALADTADGWVRS